MGKYKTKNKNSLLFKQFILKFCLPLSFVLFHSPISAELVVEGKVPAEEKAETSLLTVARESETKPLQNASLAVWRLKNEQGIIGTGFFCIPQPYSHKRSCSYRPARHRNT